MAFQWVWAFFSSCAGAILAAWPAIKVSVAVAIACALVSNLISLYAKQ